MQPPEPFLIFTRKLESLGLRYMVSGSVAAIFYGEPRLTNDVDIILFLAKEAVCKFAEAFPPQDFYCPPLDVIAEEISRDQRGHFNLIHHETGFKANIFLCGRDELHTWGLSRTIAADLDGDRIVFAPPEYVILRKLQFFGKGGWQKHLRDIQRMLLVLGDDWPRTGLMEMIQAHCLTREWQQVGSHRD